MRLSLYIDCDNAAFEGSGCGEEVARILRRLADEQEGHARSVLTLCDGDKLRDVNGNTVGRVKVDEEVLS